MIADDGPENDVARRLHDLVVPMVAEAATLVLVDSSGELTVSPQCSDLPVDTGEVAMLVDDALIGRRAQLLTPHNGVPGRLIAAVPLRTRDETHGVLVATTGAGTPQAAQIDVDNLARAAGCAALAMDSARLFGILRASEARFQQLMDRAPAGVALIELDTYGLPRYVEVNAALCTLMGQGRDELLGSVVGAMSHLDDRVATAAFLEGMFDPGARPGSHTTRALGSDGRERHMTISASPLRGNMVLCQMADFTELRESERAMVHMATRDALTDLANRSAFELVAERTIAEANRFGEPGALLILDIDHFRYLNETWGTTTGDRALRLVASTLMRRTRRTDVVARLGGDEFAVLMKRIDPKVARTVARELAADLCGLTLMAGDEAVQLSVSGGLRLFNGTASPKLCEVIGDAELALCEARDTDRGHVAEAAPDDTRIDRQRSRSRWSKLIRSALLTDGFVLHGQPIVDAVTLARSHDELLIRMIGPAGEIIGPAQFLPTAAIDGQIRAIDRWVFRDAVRILEERHAANDPVGVAVNLAGDGLCDAALMNDLVACIAAGAFPASRLIVEITETAAIDDVELARAQAERLTGLGCRLALDDFGTGFSSFTFLKNLPVNIVKIDGQFIRGLECSACDRATVRAIIDVAEVLGVGVIAEFVETEQTLCLLRELGVSHVQGHLVGAAQSLAEQ